MTKPTRRFLIAGATVLGLALGFLVEERVRGRLALRAWERGLEARGERLTIEALQPDVVKAGFRRAVSPSEANGLLIGNLSSSAPSPMRRVRPGKARVAIRLESWSDRDQVTNRWEQVTEELAPFHASLEELRHDLTNRAYAVQADYRAGFNVLLPHLAPAKTSGSMLSASALWAAHEGNLDEARDNLVALAALCEMLRYEPLVISQLVRVAVAHIGFAATWDALHAEGWREEQLAALDRGWDQPGFVLAMTDALAMERAMSVLTYQEAPAVLVSTMGAGVGGNPFGSSTGPAKPGVLTEWVEPWLEQSEGVRARLLAELWGFTWRDQDRLLHHRMLQRWIDAGRAAEQSRNGALLGVRERPAGEGTPAVAATKPWSVHEMVPDHRYNRMRYWLALGVLPGLDRALSRAVETETARALCVTAIALERCRLRRGRYPADLAALVPEFVAEVPRDWYDGGALRYRANDDGTYLLYSIGNDGQDDGGDPTPRGDGPGYWLRGRDIVWPQGATEEEVRTVGPRRAAPRRG